MHRSCRLLFPLETILLIFSMLQVARAFVQRRDDALPCNGDFAKLNNGGQSPCSLYNQTQLPCNSIGGYSPTTCQCNLVAFNLQSACSSCQSAKPWSWDDWSRKNGCPQNLTMAKDLPFTLGNVPIPSWAHNDLTADGQFDLSAALQSRHLSFYSFPTSLTLKSSRTILVSTPNCFTHRSTSGHLSSSRSSFPLVSTLAQEKYSSTTCMGGRQTTFPSSLFWLVTWETQSSS
ncbi:hypothetical protein C8Q75DRAFT_376116 [Abortiporus biennis]|nr:hypothetical protein C8Q75DRAFT_376116 [Abortiporus biennis]